MSSIKELAIAKMVGGGGGGGDVTVQPLSVTENGRYAAPSGRAYSPVVVAVPAPTLVEKNVTANGSYDPADDNADGYGRVTVNVPAAAPNLQSKTVTENGTVTADAGYDGLGEVVVNVAGTQKWKTTTTVTIPTVVSTVEVIEEDA